MYTLLRSERVRDNVGSAKVRPVRGRLENNENKRNNKGKSASVAVIVLLPFPFNPASLKAQGKIMLLPFQHVAEPVAIIPF